jgi:hypothetical protein
MSLAGGERDPACPLRLVDSVCSECKSNSGHTAMKQELTAGSACSRRVGLVATWAVWSVALGCLGGGSAVAAQVYGAIGAKYAQLGGPAGALGPALTDEAPAAFGGRFNQFTNGFIFWQPSIGAHAVLGAIAGKWVQLGREPWGYPVTDEVAVPDGRGRYTDFRAVQLAGTPTASIFWTPQTGAHGIYGAIRDKWLAMGWLHSPVGYPAGEETGDAYGGRVQGFEGGFIAYHPVTGAHAVDGLIAGKWNQLGRGGFGYPETDELATANGHGRYNTFRAVNVNGTEESSIYWSPETGAHAVYGEIRRKWGSMNWEQGRLGYPLSEEFDSNTFRRVNFQNGYIRWSRALGAQFIAIDVPPGNCVYFFRAWQHGDEDHPLQMEACQELMGLNAYCNAHNAFVGIFYIPQTDHRYLDCAPRAGPDDLGTQFKFLVNGIAQGAEQGFIAAAPFFGAAAAGISCVYGAIFACGVLALDVAQAAGVPLAGVGGAALSMAGYVPGCIDYDLSACAHLGAAGAAAAGLVIPGNNPDQTAADAQACANGEFAACASLGQQASNAAGVPVGLGPASIANSQACANGDANACIALGQGAAKGTPLGGLPNGAALASACAGGNSGACQQLGGEMVGAVTAFNRNGRMNGSLAATLGLGLGQSPAGQRIFAGANIPANIAQLQDSAILSVGGQSVRAQDVKRTIMAADNNAIIIIGGRQVTAGSVKQTLIMQSTAPPSRGSLQSVRSAPIR